MPLNKLDNFIKNTEGRILYVSPSDLDSTDSITNQGNSLAQPFKTLQRALLEAARFSYIRGNNNDYTEKTTILLMPGAHTIDNRPGFAVYDNGGTATAVSPSGKTAAAIDTLSLTLESNFDLTQEDNILYKFNSVYGGVIVPRGTSVVGLDLRKTKLRPKYVPNPTDSNVDRSAIFRITGACYFWQFCLFDGDETGLVYTDPIDFSNNNQSTPTFSHHKLTCFEYADGVNNVSSYGLTDLDMYYSKLSNAYNQASGKDIDEKYPDEPLGFAKQRPEWEIVGAFANDPVQISNIEAGQGGTVNSQITVTTTTPHNFIAGTPIKIRGVAVNDYNVSSKVQGVIDENTFTYLIENIDVTVEYNPSVSGASVTIETDTVSGASPYVFNISLRSVWGMAGMHADGAKASGFRSMVVAQFTGVSLQKDDRAFVKYNNTSRNYESLNITRVSASDLSGQSSSTTPGTAYHLDSEAIYRSGWETSHIKVSNDSFIQIVSVFAIGFTKHFDCETGGDMSITNSNSNFGQISLNSFGFKKEAFTKDDKAFVTSIIPPRAITGQEENVDWMALDVGITTNTTINPGANRLYLYGFTSADDYPPVLTQGFRIGAKVSDKLYYTVDGNEYSANILMSDGTTSSVKEYSVSGAPDSTHKFTIGTHNLSTGEKVIILSDDGDLPENIVENTVYYVINLSPYETTKIKLASSESDAKIGAAISVYGGTNLKILSRVSDKNAGDLGSPVQYDTTNNQWFIHTNANSGIYNILNSLGVANLSVRTEPSYFKRTNDSRSLDEKIYKLRVVIPKESVNAKNPENSFIIQQSSSTGYRNNTDYNASSISQSDYNFNRNLSLIAKCTRSGRTVTIISELPHNLQVGNTIIIRYVTDSTNPTGEYNLGYNGTFTVASVSNDMTFTYTLPAIREPGTFTNITSNRTTTLPRFQRNNLQENIYNYRSEIISEYIEGIQDGIYHTYILTSNISIPGEFSDLKYSQNVVDLYPQLDRDNLNDTPQGSKSFAKRSPLGEVVTNDLKKSITREATDTFLTSFGIGLDVFSVSNSTSSATITFAREHGLSGIVAHSSLTAGSGYTDGTYYNVKLLNGSQTGSWNGATAKVVVSGGAVVSANIISSGSGYSAAGLYFDQTIIGTGDGLARFTIASSGISSSIGNVVQFTGDGKTSDGYYRITSIPAKNQISIAKTAGDPIVNSNQYAFVVGNSVRISSNTITDSISGITTFNCSSPHDLVAGNRFRIIDSANGNIGDFIVETRLGLTNFTAITNKTISASNGYVLKHGLSANSGVSDSSAENLAVRAIPIFDKETLTVVEFFTEDPTRIRVSGGAGIVNRFPLGSYIQIDDEIMRIVSSTLGGTFSDEITVIRGYLATLQSNHDNGSIIKKIKPLPIEFRRPSIVRASGHTFEYLGYGPGNYSTGLPQVQVKTLTEREDFLSQSQERSAGVVVYTGMNSKGDSFVGNQKKSSATGEEITFDTPIPTITGVDPSRLSVVFDEATIKERLVVEGGNSNTVLSQFDGPVTFNKEIKINDQVTLTRPANSNSTFTLKINDSENNSTSPTTGALIVKGGVGIAKNLSVGGNTTFTGLVDINGGATIDNIRIGITNDNTIDTSSGNLFLHANTGIVNVQDNLTVSGILTTNTGLVPDTDEGAYIGRSDLPFSEAHIGEIRIADTTRNTIDTVTGDLILDSFNGVTRITDNLIVSDTTSLNSTLNVTGITTLNSTLRVIGITTLGSDLFVDGSAKVKGSLDVDGAVTFNNTLTINGALNVTGDITAFYTSDWRLKNNIVPIPDALDKVIAISGNTYDWNEKSNKSGNDVGVIAQEILEVLPEAVTTRDNGYLAVDYQKIVPLLIEAVKALSEKVDKLQEKLNDK